MFDLRELGKQVLAAVSAALAAAWPIIVGVADKLSLDISAGKAAVLAALASAGAGLLVALGDLVKQYRQRVAYLLNSLRIGGNIDE
jgi:hypothetical protein